MKVLIISNGGREHALTWKVAQSPLANQGLCCSRQCRYGAN